MASSTAVTRCCSITVAFCLLHDVNRLYASLMERCYVKSGVMGVTALPCYTCYYYIYIHLFDTLIRVLLIANATNVYGSRHKIFSSSLFILEP